MASFFPRLLLVFCKRGDVKVASLKASSFLLLTFVRRGVNAIELSASRRSREGQ